MTFGQCFVVDHVICVRVVLALSNSVWLGSVGMGVWLCRFRDGENLSCMFCK